MNIVHIFAYIGAVLLVLNVSVVGFLVWWSWQAKRDAEELDYAAEYLRGLEKEPKEKRPYAG